MHRSAYAEIVSSDHAGSRRREFEALDRVVSLLERADRASASEADRSRALDAMDDLWTLFMKDLADPENALPDALRAQLISIGLWVTRTSMVRRFAGAGELASLIEVNCAIRDGLRS